MYYRLYFLDQTNQIEDVAPFESDSDETAILIAQQRAEGRPIELWNQDRLVTRSAMVSG